VRRDIQRSRFDENGRAGITFAFGAIPKRRVMAGPKLFHIVCAAFDFLKTQHVGIFGVEKFEKIFLEH
jgi:hypothetical protein